MSQHNNPFYCFTPKQKEQYDKESKEMIQRLKENTGYGVAVEPVFEPVKEDILWDWINDHFYSDY